MAEVKPAPSVESWPDRPTTMRDIARSVGVSQSTVSRVLSGMPSSVPIADDTRQRVLAAAEEAGYRPNPLARGLRGSKTMLLGVIVRDITDPFFAGAIEAVSRAAMARGYNVVLGHAHSRADEAIALRSVLETRHCDAILLLGDMRDQPRVIADLAGARGSIVGLWQGHTPPTIPVVNVDNRSGIRQAVDHLLALGHRRFAFVSARPLGDIREREAAFVERLSETGIEVAQENIRQVPNNPAGGAKAIKELAAGPHRPTAIICSTDAVAMGVLHGAAAMGINVPGELSVTGFDDLPSSAFLVPALTSVGMPTGEMAAQAVDLAVVGEHSNPPPIVVVEPRLVIRRSTGRAQDGHSPL